MRRWIGRRVVDMNKTSKKIWPREENKVINE